MYGYAIFSLQKQYPQRWFQRHQDRTVTAPSQKSFTQTFLAGSPLTDLDSIADSSKVGRKVNNEENLYSAI